MRYKGPSQQREILLAKIVFTICMTIIAAGTIWGIVGLAIYNMPALILFGILIGIVVFLAVFRWTLSILFE